MDMLELDYIASRLEALEETIIFVLIERIQFMLNPSCYLPGKSGFNGKNAESLFSMRLKAQEEMDARFGRFLTPEERPVNRELPPSERKLQVSPRGLNIVDYDLVNLSGEIAGAYLQLLPRICTEGDDGQYGSSIERDVICIQALARRVHFASFYVAESKYRMNPESYDLLIREGKTEDIGAQLTRPEVEARILDRVRTKSQRLQEISDFSLRRVLDPEAVTALYRDVIIPLTKEGEVRYMMTRSTRPLPD
ncbi:chorismate mutase [Marispirochaeta aestuarii]|uniref:chorismate mutase n=1 Tax=Marispirochaeta aestuarii TaxID=1963862 RepID=A0A1Y1RTL3_9SPIO|nr:chorismate mutase [Marispirochaeta aestuarii]ORC31121.1 chorismate mutase [Marispirochaeta aestuarii]